MIAPKEPANEKNRVSAVRSYHPQDNVLSKDYDSITSLISTICDTPVSLITLLDSETNFFRSHHGLSFNNAPRETSFCGHAILEDTDLFIIEDAKADPRFKDNPLVLEKGFRFYAGTSLVNPEGYKLGSLCVFDTEPRTLTNTQKTTIITLAKQVVNLFELHKRNDQLESVEQELKLRNKRLEDFAGVVSHDLKSPLATITSLARLLKSEKRNAFSEETTSYLDYIEESTETLKNYINGMLAFYKSNETLANSKISFSTLKLFTEIEEMLFLNNNNFIYPTEDKTILANHPAIMQILVNLIDNGLKYNTSDNPTVKITLTESDDFYEFNLTDNGIGIPEESQEIMFDLFKVTEEKDRHGKRGYGIGLATVKNLVTKLGGNIRVASEKSKGATFTFTIKK